MIKKISLILFIALAWTSPLLAHGISAADQQAMLDGGYLKYIELGASHMLTGYDHLLFLFGVIFFLTQFKDVVKFITAFTIGHSITLIFATFMEISANYFLIDAVIALTVLYKGFDNIGGFQKYLGMKSPNLLALVFGFGLIHGFGLSTRLQQLPLGDEGLLLRILSFNLGVEVGQIVALTAMLFLLAAWRKTASFKRFSTLSNVGLICAGFMLFLMQMHGYSHDAAANEQASRKTVQDQQTLHTEGQWKDSITFTLPAGKSIEYKFLVLKDKSMQYEWKTNGQPLYFDFHGEPKNDPSGSFTSFEKNTLHESKGTLIAPFGGSHGWYWKNKGTQTVKVTLNTKGDYKIIGIQ